MMKKKKRQRASTITATGASLLLTAATAQGALVSYHDFGATTGFESTGNITTHQSGSAAVSNNVVDVTLKQLIDYSNGAPTGIFLSIGGANGMDSRNGGQFLPPAGGTPADALFNVPGLNLNNGSIFEQNGQTVLTLTGLSPTKIYDIALYGDRTAASDGVERFTLGGAAAAINSSSTGIINTFTTDQNTRPNNATGDVIRWTSILAGGDGAVTITMDPTVTSAANLGYLSALRLEETEPLPQFVAYHDLSGITPDGPGGTNVVTENGSDGSTANGTFALVNYADGAGTGITLTTADWFGNAPSAAGTAPADWFGNAPSAAGTAPAAGTDAAELFGSGSNTIVTFPGVLNAGGLSDSGSANLTFAGLDPNTLYDVAIYGDRAAAQDGLERFTLLGADGAVNISSVGIISDFVTDMHTRPNSATGNVVRWTDINPGADGTFTINVDPEFSTANNIVYLSAIRLEALPPVAIPEPAVATMMLVGLVGLGRRARRIS